MTDVITTSQIEPILDDFLGVDCPHYEELRKRCAQRIVDLYANRCPVSEWRDISTAPKDNCIVLCVEGYQPSIGRWWPKDECWTSFDWEGHFESDAEVTQYVRGCQYEPTHWQPLPAPPQRNEEPRG